MADTYDATGRSYSTRQRPEAYLDPEVQAGISSFSLLATIKANLERLESDLASGRWEKRNAHLRECSELDVGYRLVVAERRPHLPDERGS